MDGMKPGTVHMDGASLELSYSAIVPANSRGDAFEISNLFTERSKRGHNRANSLMQEVCDQADQAGKLLLIMPEAFDSGGPSTAQLVDWYVLKHGFTLLQIDPKTILIRMPQHAAQQWTASNA